MADEKTSAKRSAAEPESAPPEETPAYEVERLIEESDAFLGYPSHVAAGGLHGVTEPLTVDDAKASVEAWLASPVPETEEVEE